MANSRKTIGVMYSIVDTLYRSGLWSGISEAARLLDINTFVFCGLPLVNTYDKVIEEQALYQLIQEDTLDGLLIEAGTIVNYIGFDALQRRLEPFKNIPKTTLSVQLEGCHYVVLDNLESMKKVVDHLIDDHHLQRIAFVTGALDNHEAKLRYEGYQKSLREHRMLYDENLVYFGDFSRQSGIDAAKTILNRHIVLPDAFVCSNDEIAIGVFEVLKQKGISVPAQVTVTGFDDIGDAKSLEVPLTTLRQSFFDLGKQAMYTAFDALLQNQPLDTKYINGRLIERESCGCGKLVPDVNSTQLKFYQIFTTQFVYDQVTLTETIRDNHSYIVELVLELIQVETSRETIIEEVAGMFVSIKADLSNDRIEGDFLQALTHAMKKTIDMNLFEVDWQNFIVMLIKFKEYVSLDLHLAFWFDEVGHLANFVNSQMQLSKERKKEMLFKDLYYEISLLFDEMSSVQNKKDCLAALGRIVKRLSLSSFYLCLFETSLYHPDGTTVTYPESTHMALGFENSVPVEPCTFLTKDLLPKALLEKDHRVDYIFFPVVYRNTHFGYIVADLISLKNSVFNSLREVIGNTLYRLSLMESLETKNQQLYELSVKDSLTGFYNRRGFYTMAQEAIQTDTLKHYLFCFGDLDGLKGINDQHGHEAGDIAIQTASDLLNDALPSNTIIGRVGGDEFLMLLPDAIYVSNPDQLIERVQKAFKSFNQASDLPYTIAMSLGYAVYRTSDHKTMDEVISAADKHLYSNKARTKTRNI